MIASFLLWLATDCRGWAGFDAPARYATSADRALLVRDLDGDGAPEIIASGNQVDEVGAFSLFANRGSGRFAAERLLPSGFGEKLEEALDLDGDGIPDLLASNYWSNGIAVYRGRGSLQFDAEVPYATATHGGPSRVIDYDGDGLRDVVSLSFGSGNPVRLHLFRGRADGTLAPKMTIDTGLANGATPSMRAIGGVLEMLVAEHSGHLGLLRFTGGGAAVSRIDVGPGIDLASLFADVDGDGIADIVATSDAGAILVALGNADGTFAARRAISTLAAFSVVLQAGDVDGDGHADIVANDVGTPYLYVLRGDGAGNFDHGVVLDAGGLVNDVKAADVNGDGRLDLVTANSDHTLSVLLNRGPCSPSRRHAVGH